MLGSRVEASFDCAVGAALAKTVKQAATTNYFFGRGSHSSMRLPSGSMIHPNFP